MLLWLSAFLNGWFLTLRFFFLNRYTLALPFLIRCSAAFRFGLELNFTNDLRSFELWSFDLHFLYLRLNNFRRFYGFRSFYRSNRLFFNRFRLGFFGCATLGFGRTVECIKINLIENFRTSDLRCFDLNLFYLRLCRLCSFLRLNGLNGRG